MSKESKKHHEPGEACNLPVFELDKDMAEGLMFTYTGVCDVQEDIDTWGVYNGKIIWGSDVEHAPSWKLNAVPIASIPTPSENL